ncbi:MAG TPA: flagellar biosynthesis anti-sigma factor FlgM [Acidobacteriaceae bacterium]|nr:flagellar biosynthesis anti-sigma factor FlgM [Acidobacteriaceae bacterium]
MNVQNDLQGLQQLFSSQEVPQTSGKTGTVEPAGTKAGGADQATLSSAGSLASGAPLDSDVRMEKVAAIQQAVVSGTYNVPATEVAGKMIDHMLGKQ